MKEGGIGDSRASLHAKAFVLDRKWVFIGSLNLDPRSVVQNTEIGVVFESTEIAEFMSDGFDNKIGKLAFRLELENADKGNERIVWHGIVDGFMRILPIESQI